MPRCWSEQCPPQAGLHSPKAYLCSSTKCQSNPAGGSRCPGAPALTWAPERTQPLSSSHPQTWSDAPMPGPTRARSRDALPGAREKLRTRDLLGAGQTCGGERGAPGRPGLGPGDARGRAVDARAIRIPVLQRGGWPLSPVLRRTARVAALTRGPPPPDGGAAPAPPAGAAGRRSRYFESSRPEAQGPEGTGSSALLPPPPTHTISAFLHCSGSNALTLGAPWVLGKWSESSLQSRHALTTSHRRRWTVWLKASLRGAVCTCGCDLSSLYSPL